ncbi:MAG: 4'-phosphopantetheinyl transferase superfamily protein [Phenylobacterium sp.]
MDAEQIARLFTVPVSACVATPEMYGAQLFPQEQDAVAKAVVRRRREFAAGRACARAAPSGLGLIAGPIAVGADRGPVWPHGYLGSITHCDGFCCAIAARSSAVRGLGIDVEGADPFEPEMARLICRPDELARFAAVPGPTGSSWPKLAFSAKEAFYKCYRPLAATVLDFLDVSVWFSPGQTASEGRFRIALEAPGKPLDGLQSAFRGRWRIEAGRVHAGVTLL